jgi:hypothetical protein
MVVRGAAAGASGASQHGCTCRRVQSISRSRQQS